MKHNLIVSVGALCLLMGAIAVAAAKDKVDELDFSQPYLLIASNSTKKLQRKADQAAAAGYRVVAGEDCGWAEDCLLMKKLPPSSPPYQYRVIFDARDQEKLNQAAAEGFRLPRHGVWSSRKASTAVMEKAPGDGVRFEYMYLGTSRAATLEMEMNEAARQGYVLVKLFRADPPQAIMERPVAKAAGDERVKDAALPMYRILATTKQATVEMEVEQATAGGAYAVRDMEGGATNHKVVLERVSLPVARKYHFLRTPWNEEGRQKQMNEAAAQGYRPHPGRARVLWVMESGETGQPPEYLVLKSSRVSGMRNELIDAVGQGYEPVDGELAVLQKPGTRD